MAKIKIKINIPYKFKEDEKPVIEKTEFSTSGKLKFGVTTVARKIKKPDFDMKEINADIYKAVKKDISKIKLVNGKVRFK